MEILIAHQYVPDDAPLDETDVLEQRDELAEVFRAMGFTVNFLSMQTQLDLLALKELSHKNCIVFNLCESLFGRDDMLFLVPFMLEQYGIPFTGSSSSALALSCHKLESKKILALNNMPTPAYITSGDTYSDKMKGPYIVKPYNTHGSINITQNSIIHINSKHDFDVLKELLSSSPDLFAEEYIDGRELNISLLLTDDGVCILPHSEIMFNNYPPDMFKIVDYEAKWIHESFAYENTIRSFAFTPDDQPILMEINRLSLIAWDLFSLNGYARIDYRVRGSEIFILEINANPCISVFGGFMSAVKQHGLSPRDVLLEIIKHPVKTEKILS